MQIGCAVAAAFPAAIDLVAVLELAFARDPLAEIDDAHLERGEGHDHLERRAGRIGAADRAIDHWVVLGGLEAAHQPAAGRPGHLAGVELRHGGHDQNFAGRDIECDECGSLFARQACQHLGLQTRVDGGDDIVARCRLGALEIAHDTAARVDLVLDMAALAAQLVLHAALDAELADAHAGQAQHGVVIECDAIDCADMADDMPDGGAVEVAAMAVDLGPDARRVGARTG